jgi:hypothetical protein
MRAFAFAALLAFIGIEGTVVSPAYAQSTHDAQPTGPEIGRIVIVNIQQTERYIEVKHTFGDVEVIVQYTSTPNWGVEDDRDRITISVPDGYIAIPPEVILPENDTVEVAIYEAIVG